MSIEQMKDPDELEAKLENTIKFFTLTLAVDAEGHIKGAAAYDGHLLEGQTEAVAAVCHASARAISIAAPKLLATAELVATLAILLTDTEEKLSDEGNSTNSTEPTATAFSGQLKQHGTVVH